MYGRARATASHIFEASIRDFASSMILGHEHIFSQFRSSDSAAVETFLNRSLEECRNAGVSDIVDLTTYVNPSRHVQLIAQNGVNLWCSVGFYLEQWVPSPLRQAPVDRLVRYLLDSARRRGARTPIACVKWAARHPDLSAFEKRAASACVIAARELSIPLISHSPHGGLEHLKWLIDLGMDPARVAISHPEMELKGRFARPPKDVQRRITEIVNRGATVCITDLYSTGSRADAGTIRILESLIGHGLSKQAFISSDASWHVKRGVPKFRGAGMSAGFVTCLAALTKLRASLGGDAPEIRALSSENPRLFYRLASKNKE